MSSLAFFTICVSCVNCVNLGYLLIEIKLHSFPKYRDYPSLHIFPKVIILFYMALLNFITHIDI